MERRIKTMIGLGVLGIIVPFLGVPITPKVYIVSGIAVVYTIVALSVLYASQEKAFDFKDNNVVDDRESDTEKYTNGRDAYEEGAPTV